MNEQTDSRDELQKERDLLEMKLHVMHRRYDQQRKRIDWIYSHPFKFILGLIKHRAVKRDHVYEED